MPTVTIHLTDEEAEILRHRHFMPYSPIPTTRVLSKVMAALPAPRYLPQVGDRVRYKRERNRHAFTYARMEVIAVRGERVYCIDADGDSCDWDASDLERVQ